MYCCDTMMKTFTTLMQKYTQKLRKPRCPRVLPWLNKDIHQLMKKRDHALKQSLVTRNHSDTLIFKGLRNKVHMAKTCYFMQLMLTQKGKAQHSGNI